jgi:hypothetical protein
MASGEPRARLDEAEVNTITAKVLVPSFTVDTRGVRIVGGDYEPSDLANIMAQPRVHDAALALYRLAPRPTLAYTCGPGPARSLAAHLRLGGLRAIHVDDGNAVDVIQQTVADLVAGKFDVVTNGARLAGARSIAGVTGVMLVRPVNLPEMHFRYLGRLDPTGGEVTIYDLAENCRRHGLPAGWVETVTVGPSAEIIRDPMISRITEVPFKDVMRWAKGNPARLEIVAKAKNFKSGWVFHAIQSFDPVGADRWWAARGKASSSGPRGPP